MTTDSQTHVGAPEDFAGTLPVEGHAAGAYTLVGLWCALPLAFPAWLMAGVTGLTVFVVAWLVAVLSGERLSR